MAVIAFCVSSSCSVKVFTAIGEIIAYWETAA
jgi:hypothetical protein